VEIPEDRIPLIIGALEHMAAYRKSQRYDDRPYLELAEKLKRKPAASETGKPTRAKKSG
jgi:hypothetical protein